jgi:hypothetical protein
MNLAATENLPRFRHGADDSAPCEPQAASKLLHAKEGFVARHLQIEK